MFLTPEGEPFYCGTYFPREQFRGWCSGWPTPGARTGGGVTGGRADRRGLAEQPAASGGRGRAPAGGRVAARRASGGGGAGLESIDDGQRGGFGGAPKFPPSMVLEFLLRHRERTGALRRRGRCAWPADLEAMARGGMYDQLGGGFARYRVDAAWVVPHFEKMLYDNALLPGLRALVAAAPARARPAGGRGDRAWMIARLGTTEGGFASRARRRQRRREGAAYAWTPAELAEVLGRRRRGVAAGVFGVTEAGTFEHGRRCCSSRADPAEPARFAPVSAALLAARARRVRPARDDKVVAAWNGLAIAALAEAGLLLDRPEFTRPRAARPSCSPGRTSSTAAGPDLPRRRRGASAGVLEDYARGRGLARPGRGDRGGALADFAGELLETGWPGSPTPRAASTTPPTTPRR